MSPLRRPLCQLACALAAFAAPASAQVSWADWTASGTNTVTGTMMFGGVPVGVTYTGLYSFVQLGCGTNYWTPTSTYMGAGVPNAPTNCEMIGLSTGGTKTLTFSQPVTDPLLALVSWNVQPNVRVGGPVVVVNTGPGTFGSGAITVTPTGFSTNGEVHGVIRVQGTYTSLTFTDDSEHWHGLTVGATSMATSVVPEPSTITLLAGGLLLVGAGAARRRRQ